MKISRQRIRTVAALTVLALGTAGLTAVSAPVAVAATGEQVAKLPVSSYSALVVDSVNQRVYVTDENRSRNAGRVLVYNFQGEYTGSLATDTSPSGMALSTDASRLYVSQTNGILSFDTQTQTRTGQAYAAYVVECPRDVAFAGGKQWYTEVAASSDCDTRNSRLYTAEGTGVGYTGWNDSGRLRLWSGPEVPGRLIMGQSRTAGVADPFLTTFDATGSTLVRGPERRFAGGDGKGALDLKDVAQSFDGTRIAVADAAAGTRLLDAADLSDAPVQYQPLPDGATASAVAFSGDGRYLARGASGHRGHRRPAGAGGRPGGPHGAAGVRLRRGTGGQQGRPARPRLVGGRFAPLRRHHQHVRHRVLAARHPAPGRRSTTPASPGRSVPLRGSRSSVNPSASGGGWSSTAPLPPSR
nr:hypothetical protein [Streptomyces sp. Termitarium-T10T-6]